MASLIEIQNEIEKLQKRAADIRAKEFDATVREIVGKMQAFGITLKDLQQALGKAGTPRKARGKPTGKRAGGKGKAAVAAKYRGPGGETWSGRGRAPRWLAALEAAGRKREEFAVAG